MIPFMLKQPRNIKTHFKIIRIENIFYLHYNIAKWYYNESQQNLIDFHIKQKLNKIIIFKTEIILLLLFWSLKFSK